MLNNSKLLSATIFVLILGVLGCTQQQQDASKEKMPETNFTKAIAKINALPGNEISGTVTFEKDSAGVKVTASLSGLAAGRHGFHIHQYGDCTAEDGTSAGGHYNPTNNDHGAPTQDNRHMGDMGNIVADSDGNATLEYTDPVIKLNGPDSIIGRAIILHSGEDDLESQPSGAAGARIGCGVIGVASAE